ncbi:MAG TPA: VOC family protein [Oscillatoriaceae cyanobacterium]
MITGMDFVSLPVTDMARARDFYQNKLGLKPGNAIEGMWVEYDLGEGPALALINPEAYGMTFAPVKTGGVAIAAHDFEGETQKHKAELVGEPFESPVCHGAFLEDPDGNRLMLHRRKSEPERDREMDVVVLPMQDMARARAFYEGTLGLKPESINGEGWIEYVLPDGSALALGDVRALGMEFAPVKTGSVGLRTPDVETVFEKLKQQGLADMETVYETPVCFMGFVHDSEGNALVLHRHK